MIVYLVLERIGYDYEWSQQNNSYVWHA
jgi:hypothetical protein